MNTVCLKCGKAIQAQNPWYGLHRNCFSQAFGTEAPEEFLDIAVRSQSQAPGEDRRFNSSFFHGKFRKYAARLGLGNFILKVEQNEYPELPTTEYVCNQIFKNLKMDVPPFHLIRFPKWQFCFATRNFMADLREASLVHIYHFVRGGDHDCQTLVDIIGSQTGRRIDQERFAYLTLADSLIGNNDRHGRNLGFIETAKGMRLAPFYDNPSAIGIEDESFLEADLRPRGAIFTKASREPTMKDYILEWRRLGYEKVIEDFTKNLSPESIENIVKKSCLSKKRQDALLQLVVKRSSELCAN